MKVKELIKRLSKLDPSYDVVIEEFIEIRLSEVTTDSRAIFKEIAEVLDLEGKVAITCYD